MITMSTWAFGIVDTEAYSLRVYVSLQSTCVCVCVLAGDYGSAESGW